MLAYSGHVMTLANSIIGVGILAMPFCFQKCGILLSIVLLIVSNWTTRICCHYLIKSSLLTRRKSLEFLGFHSFGPSGKMLVELCIIGYLLGTCVTYFVVVGDLGPQIVTKMFALQEHHTHLRVIVMSIVTLFCILPLGMLKKVDSLAAVCTASIGFYFCLIIKIVLESKEHVLANDWSEKVNYWRPAGILQCLPIFSMALACQMQLFEVFGNINNASIDKLNSLVKNAIWICTAVYIGVGFFGYVAFCNQKFSGNILLNFSPSLGSDVIKIGFVLSVAFSFPLIIFPCRASIYSLLYRKGHVDSPSYMPESRFKLITIFIVFCSLCFAIVLPSVELVIGLVGSTIGVAISIMFPALCFRRIIKKDSNEKSLAQFILVAGFCLMILGTYANLNAIDENRSGAHLEKEIIENNILKPVSPNLISEAAELKNLEETMNGKNVDVKNVAKDVQVDKPATVKIDNKENQLKATAEIEIVQPLESNKQQPPVLQPEEKVKEFKPSNNLSINLEQPKQQGIDNDAIKKDEEVAAEESKNNKQTNANANAEVLEKTQNELKEAKELLEELAKKNKETQNVVVEKLDKIAEKVDKIERQVQQSQDKQQVAAKAPEQSENKQVKTETTTAAISKSKVYEPISYLAGELLEIAKNNSKLDARIPLPLALLINSAQAKNKTNTSSQNSTDVKSNDDNAKNALNQAQNSKELAKTAAAELAKTVDDNAVKAIRRNILQSNHTPDANKIELSNKSDAEAHRTKRSEVTSRKTICTNNIAEDDKNCLTKLETDDL